MSEQRIPYEDLKRANDLLQRQVCDFANTRPALIAERDALREALIQTIERLEMIRLWRDENRGLPMMQAAIDLGYAALGSTTEAGQ